MAHYIGIDIGGTKIAGAVVNDSGQLSNREEVATPVKEGGPRILEEAIKLARSIASASGKDIQGIGIGAGGQIDTTRGLIYSATDVLPGWKGLRITEAFTNALQLPTKVDNDVNVLALGESRFGAARAFAAGTVVFLALGTGVGGALLCNGAVHHGAHWSGGEFGHILLTMDPDARCDTGGARGTLEAYCSGPGLVQTWRELSGNNDVDMTGFDVVNDAKSNPTGAGQAAIARTGEYLGYGLVSLANALDPDLIVIGGGLAQLGDSLLTPARRILKEHGLPGPASAPVVTAELGADAAIIGAASLVIAGGV
jgi:glucokinase